MKTRGKRVKETKEMEFFNRQVNEMEFFNRQVIEFTVFEGINRERSSHRVPVQERSRVKGLRLNRE